MFHMKQFLSTWFSTWLKTFQRVYQLLKTFFLSLLGLCGKLFAANKPPLLISRRRAAADPPPLYLFFFSLHRRRHSSAANKPSENHELFAQKDYFFSLTSKQKKLSDTIVFP